MKPAPFDYVAAQSLDEALRIRADNADDCVVLAGGQSLVPALSLRLARPSLVLDINKVQELDSILSDDGVLVVGAMCRQRTLERSVVVAERIPLLAQALQHVAHPAIRCRGTIGGSIAHADPAAELPAIAVALEATIVLRNAREYRHVAAEDFFTGWFTTALQPDELITEVRLPAQDALGHSAFVEIARRHGDFAIVGVAVIAAVTDGVLSRLRIVVMGVSGSPQRLRALEDAGVGMPLTSEAFAALGREAAAAVDPQGDIHASAAYRRRLTAVLVARALAAATGNSP